MNKNIIEAERESCEVFLESTEPLLEDESLTKKEQSEVLQQRMITIQRLKILNILLRDE
jgi:hypothetical protein